MSKVPKAELSNRMTRFLSAMGEAYENWEICAIIDGMSLYYMTGTIVDGVLLIRRGYGATLWVRKSYERAATESEFEDIRLMGSFRDIANSVTALPDTLYLEMSAATMEWYGLFSKHLPFANVKPVDRVILNVRAVKSPYEIDIMRRAGAIIDRLLREELPCMLYEGISEAELGAKLYGLFIKNGYHGVSRFSMRNADVVLGHIGFAESSLYPSVFNGASGLVGLCPAAPVLGSRDVKLAKGNLMYIDIGFGLEGYNVDKTMVFSYREPQTEAVNDIHRHCLDLEKKAVSMLCAGVKPSTIYESVCEQVRRELRDRFMGTAGRTVRFLGHGVGLYIDEYPVLAKGFDQPLISGMTIAIEPKIGLAGVGMVGSENTYLITGTSAESITGDASEIIVC